MVWSAKNLDADWLADVRDELEPLGVVVPSGGVTLHACEAWMRDVESREARIKALRDRIDTEQNAIDKIRDRIADFIRAERAAIGTERLAGFVDFEAAARRPSKGGKVSFRNAGQIAEHMDIHYEGRYTKPVPDERAFLDSCEWSEPDEHNDIRPIDPDGRTVPGLVKHLPRPDEFSVRWKRKGEE